mmetsp:Transcript_2481/g.7913  ORF Transcript_2481/g.7913 Transcript_2481/m.7913 type:complete len:233 (-) Transcript_2481:159-857(-)
MECGNDGTYACPPPPGARFDRIASICDLSQYPASARKSLSHASGGIGVMSCVYITRAPIFAPARSCSTKLAAHVVASNAALKSCVFVSGASSSAYVRAASSSIAASAAAVLAPWWPVVWTYERNFSSRAEGGWNCRRELARQSALSRRAECATTRGCVSNGARVAVFAYTESSVGSSFGTHPSYRNIPVSASSARSSTQFPTSVPRSAFLLYPACGLPSRTIAGGAPLQFLF